nr:glycosyltransferase family 2 protein [Shimia sp. CNT1-13L.2]
MIRNECDIVEQFVRHNSQIFDHIYFLNHFSSDSTLEILSRLQAEGVSLSVRHLRDPSYRQADFTTAASRLIAASGRFDYIMPLDADEFLCVERANFIACLEAYIGHAGAARVPRKTFCPLPLSDCSEGGSWHERFRARSREVRQYYKVVFGRTVGETCRISTGNHDISAECPLGQIPILPFYLQHVPVRSSEQIVRKALLGSSGFALGGRRNPTEGYHWTAMADQARNNGYVFSDTELMLMAQRYSLIDSDLTPSISPSSELEIWGGACEYADRAKINLVEALDCLVQETLNNGLSA